jgi:hypothetical protein
VQSSTTMESVARINVPIKLKNFTCKLTYGPHPREIANAMDCHTFRLEKAAADSSTSKTTNAEVSFLNKAMKKTPQHHYL